MCLAPFCRNEGTCIDNPKSIQGYNCVCVSSYFGETCNRHYLNCNLKEKSCKLFQELVQKIVSKN